MNVVANKLGDGKSRWFSRRISKTYFSDVFGRYHTMEGVTLLPNNCFRKTNKLLSTEGRILSNATLGISYWFGLCDAY